MHTAYCIAAQLSADLSGAANCLQACDRPQQRYNGTHLSNESSVYRRPESFDSIAERFESAWCQGQQPSLDDFLAGVPTEHRAGLLCELIQIDLERRIKANQTARLEEYLERYPELAQQQAIVLTLVLAEYRCRREREPNLTACEYIHRFPHLEAEIKKRFSEPRARHNSVDPLATTEQHNAPPGLPPSPGIP
jgi:hypothetical protein